MKKLKKLLIFVLLLGAAAAAAVLVVIPSLRYKQAEKYMEEGSYAQALQTFDALRGYRDSAERKAQAYVELEKLLTGAMSRSVQEADALLRDLPVELDSTKTAAFREICAETLPYCGSYLWDTEELKGDRRFSSDFSYNDGQLYWHYSGAELNALDFAIGTLKVQDHAFFAAPTPVEDMVAAENWLEVIVAQVSFADGKLCYDYRLSLLGNLGESLIHYEAEKVA